MSDNRAQNSMHQYKNLVIWQKSTMLCLALYKITATFPDTEKFGLTNQLRRAAVSIPSNIAEGSKRSTKKDFRSFLAIAHGSGAEVETQLYIAKELTYISEKEYSIITADLEEVMKMLGTLIKKFE